MVEMPKMMSKNGGNLLNQHTTKQHMHDVISHLLSPSLVRHQRALSPFPLSFHAHSFSLLWNRMMKTIEKQKVAQINATICKKKLLPIQMRFDFYRASGPYPKFTRYITIGKATRQSFRAVFVVVLCLPLLFFFAVVAVVLSLSTCTKCNVLFNRNWDIETILNPSQMQTKSGRTAVIQWLLCFVACACS